MPLDANKKTSKHKHKKTVTEQTRYHRSDETEFDLFSTVFSVWMTGRAWPAIAKVLR